MRSRFSILFVLLMFCIACHTISKSYGFYFPADEFGYWSYAASLAGYDWTDITSLSSYYSYGYSVILFPVFMLFHDGVIAYRAALAVNYVLLAVCFFVLQKIGKEVGEETGNKISPFYAAAAVFYPTWIFYAGTTFAEILLVTLYIVICALFCQYLKTGRKCFAVLMMAAMLYIYFVHMRAVGVLLAGMITLTVYDLRDGRKRAGRILLSTACAALVLAAGMIVKNRWTDMVYCGVQDGLKNVNDYAGQVGKIAYICTMTGMKNFVISLSGKILYLGLASFGTAYYGIRYALSQAVRPGAGRSSYFYIFVLVSTLAAVAISAVYTVYPGRVDTLTYGRYHEYVMPVLMITGIMALRDKGQTAKRTIRGIAVILVSEAVMTGLVIHSLRTYGQTAFFGNTICGISWLYDPGQFEPVSFYCRAYLAGALLTVLACMGIWWTGRQRGREIFLVLLVAVQIAAGMRLSSVYVDASRLGCLRDTFMAGKIQELYLGDMSSDRREVFYSTGGEDFGNIGILQFMMRDIRIHIVKEDFAVEDQDAGDLLLTDFNSSQADVLEKAYTKHLTSGHFTLYYNEVEK